MLIISTVLAYCIIRLIFGSGDASQGGKSSDIEIVLGHKTIKIRALQDSGNNLRDPYTGTPVIVASAEDCAALFPEAVGKILKNNLSPTDMLEKISVYNPKRFALIPFSTASGSGLMLVIRPDKVMVNGKSQSYIIGVSQNEINAAGNCRAVIGV
jgi:stage II sporulation protein GA (sporulation sigma-E factor processing peptidase)